MVINSTNAITLNPGESIKNTVNTAISGDTIVLDVSNSGEFNISNLNEANIIVNKNITLKSSKSSQNAIINLHKVGRAFNITSQGNLTLINITIKNGQSNINGYDDGGALINKGKVTLAGCIFTNNRATNDGGAIYNLGGSTLIVKNCTFTNNKASYTTYGGIGGAIYSDENSKTTVTDCTFTNNTAVGGSAIANEGKITLARCTFTNNKADYGGTIENFGTLTVKNCTFTNNKTHRGGAIDNDGTATLTGCTFTNNKATYGGAICNEGKILTVKNCTFTNNTVTYDGGAIWNYKYNLIVKNCTFENNKAKEGGAISNGFGGTATLIGCIFTNNTAKKGYYKNTICNDESSKVAVISCTFDSLTKVSTFVDPANKRGTFTEIKDISKLTVGKKGNINIIVHDYKGKIIKKGKVILKFDNKWSFTVNIVHGLANFSHTFIKAGNNRLLKISYMKNSNNIASSMTTNVVVNKN